MTDKCIYLKDGKQVSCKIKDATKVRLLKYTINSELYLICTTPLTDDKVTYSFEFVKELISTLG